MTTDPSTSPDNDNRSPGSPKVVYVAGWGRSGSTLLNSLLTRRGVVAVGELRWLWSRGVVGGYACSCRESWQHCQLWGAVVNDFTVGNADPLQAAAPLQKSFTRAARKALLRSALRLDLSADGVQARKLYELIAAKSGAQVVVDTSKSPEHAALARASGLDVTIVHLVRDARGVTWSNRRMKARPDGVSVPPVQARRRPAYVAARWALRNLAIGFAVRPDLRLRYEDMAADPAAALDAIFEAAGLRTPPEGGASHAISGNSNRFAAIPKQLRADDEWIDAQPASHRIVTTMLTAPLLTRYGYPLRKPARAAANTAGV
jgi:hypothetical protein